MISNSISIKTVSKYFLSISAKSQMNPKRQNIAIRFQTTIATLSNFTTRHKSKSKLFNQMNMKPLKTQLTYHNLIKMNITIQVQRIINWKKRQIYLKVNLHRQFFGSMTITSLLSLMGTDLNRFFLSSTLFRSPKSNIIQSFLLNSKKQ